MPKKANKSDPIVLFFVQLRLTKKLTQQQVVDRCEELSLSTYQRIEQGKSDLSMSQFRNLCDLYGVTSLDVSLGEMRYRPTSSADVAATAKLLPKRLREPLLELMVAVGEELQRKRR